MNYFAGSTGLFLLKYSQIKTNLQNYSKKKNILTRFFCCIFFLLFCVRRSLFFILIIGDVKTTSFKNQSAPGADFPAYFPAALGAGIQRFRCYSLKFFELISAVLTDIFIGWHDFFLRLFRFSRQQAANTGYVNYVFYAAAARKIIIRLRQSLHHRADGFRAA